MLTITACLFLAGIAMGSAFACVWAWGVRSGQFRELENTKHQLFWPEVASPDAPGADPQNQDPPKGRL